MRKALRKQPYFCRVLQHACVNYSQLMWRASCCLNEHHHGAHASKRSLPYVSSHTRRKGAGSASTRTRGARCSRHRALALARRRPTATACVRTTTMAWTRQAGHAPGARLLVGAALRTCVCMRVCMSIQMCFRLCGWCWNIPHMLLSRLMQHAGAVPRETMACTR